MARRSASAPGDTERAATPRENPPHTATGPARSSRQILRSTYRPGGRTLVRADERASSFGAPRSAAAALAAIPAIPAMQRAKRRPSAAPKARQNITAELVSADTARSIRPRQGLCRIRQLDCSWTNPTISAPAATMLRTFGMPARKVTLFQAKIRLLSEEVNEACSERPFKKGTVIRYRDRVGVGGRRRRIRREASWQKF